MVRIAQGTKDPTTDGIRQIAIRFPEAVFAEIALRASQENLSFAEYVRLLVSGSLDKLKEKT